MHRETGRQERRGGGKAGFTLVEIMLVVVILGILATVVIVQFRGQGIRARINATRTSIQNICTAIDAYEVETGKLPGSLKDLTVATSDRPGLLREMPSDSWGTEFQYKTQSDFDYEVRSAGPDMQMGTGDDITN